MTEQDAAVPAQAEQGPEPHSAKLPATTWQTGIGVAVAMAALGLAWGTWQLPGEVHINDGGARLVPGICAFVLLLCGLWLVWEARHGGWRNVPAPSAYASLQMTPWVWVSAGLLLSALLVAHSGFVVAAALCYVLALQGLRLAQQPGLRTRGLRLAADLLAGLLVAGLVYVLFTQVLGIHLPAGWLAWS